MDGTSWDGTSWDVAGRDAMDWLTSDLGVVLLAVVVAVMSYVVTRLMMRRRWLRIVLNLAVWTAIAGIVAYAALFLLYYRLDAWLPLGWSLVSGLAAMRATWVVFGFALGAVLALRRPVRERPEPVVTSDEAVAGSDA